MKYKNESAFPGLHPSKDCQYNDPGMTLRDYFAAKALPAAYRDLWDDVRAGRTDRVPEDWRFGVAVEAYKMADAMLKARGE